MITKSSHKAVAIQSGDVKKPISNGGVTFAVSSAKVGFTGIGSRKDVIVMKLGLQMCSRRLGAIINMGVRAIKVMLMDATDVVISHYFCCCKKCLEGTRGLRNRMIFDHLKVMCKRCGGAIVMVTRVYKEVIIKTE
jgi:hypothetical protein